MCVYMYVHVYCRACVQFGFGTWFGVGLVERRGSRLRKGLLCRTSGADLGWLFGGSGPTSTKLRVEDLTCRVEQTSKKPQETCTAHRKQFPQDQ